MLLQAIDDTRLYGEGLVQPLRFCTKQLRSNFSPYPVDMQQSEKIFRLFQRVLSCTIFSIATVPAACLAGVGILVKWVDLGRRINQFTHHGPAITYSFPFILEQVSRVGDRLVAYLHTKYVSEKYSIPLYFQPFKGAEYFALSKEEHFKAIPETPTYFAHTVYLKSQADIEALSSIDPNSSTLYVLPYFPESLLETEKSNYWSLKYPIDWQTFKPRVTQLLKVVKTYQPIAIPKKAFSIALHIRTGGTVDSRDMSTLFPGKLPPKEYYIDELEKLLKSSHIPHNQPLYIHFFTDDTNPQKIHDWLKDEMVKRDLFTLTKGQELTLNFSVHSELQDDIANMQRFDCLIRPDSNLSWSMAKASDRLKIEIFPIHFKVDAAWNQIMIDKVICITPTGSEVMKTDYTIPVVTRFPLPKWFYQWFHHTVFGV